ncbi:hypothetical protein GE09DRAFT_546968 [Coniochaeta sp. 2T2.1]|nr:hypothetical protein GE09DRAFT_546968 [Coniochaeta sp. 2T2.1]
MALVDYTSSSDSESSSPPAKKRKQSISSTLKSSPSKPAKPPSSSQLPPLRPSRPSSKPPQPSSTSQPPSQPQTSLPPLPPTFHDLYAHTVRHSPVDIPSQHQNRRRTNPHVAGNWPSHVYIEWRPSSQQHLSLSSFLSTLQTKLSSNLSSNLSSGVKKDVELHQFLTSDLGAPLPLHVSLSRPFVLTTGEKDEFLERIKGEIEGSKVGGGRRFRLSCAGGVGWHRTGESGRSFLVLRIRSLTSSTRRHHSNEAEEGSGENETGENRQEDKDEDAEREDGEEEGGGERTTNRNRNPELTTLLSRCNKTVASYGQPALYAWATTDGEDAGVGDAFHVSIAWSFAEPDEEVRRVTEEVFAEARFGEGIKGMEFEVDGVKVKIGNVVCHVPLGKEGGKRKGGMFGI